MSLFSDYAAERYGTLTIEEEYGFIQYMFMPDAPTVFIVEVFVSPKHRGGGLSKDHAFSRLAEMVVADAKTKGCNKLIGRIVPSLPHASKIMKCHLWYGMEITSANEDAIWTMKEI